MRRPLAASALSTIALCLRRVVGDVSCARGGVAIVARPAPVVVAVGGSFSPQASWCRGGRYEVVPPQWSLGSAADANILAVDRQTGRITGKRVGRATVIATHEGAEGARVSVTVE